MRGEELPCNVSCCFTGLVVPQPKCRSQSVRQQAACHPTEGGLDDAFTESVKNKRRASRVKTGLFNEVDMLLACRSFSCPLQKRPRHLQLPVIDSGNFN